MLRLLGCLRPSVQKQELCREEGVADVAAKRQDEATNRFGRFGEEEAESVNDSEYMGWETAEITLHDTNKFLPLDASFSSQPTTVLPAQQRSNTDVRSQLNARAGSETPASCSFSKPSVLVQWTTQNPNARSSTCTADLPTQTQSHCACPFSTANTVPCHQFVRQHIRGGTVVGSERPTRRLFADVQSTGGEQAVDIRRSHSLIEPPAQPCPVRDDVGERVGIDMQACTKELSRQLMKDKRLRCVLSKIDIIRLQTHVLMCALDEDSKGTMGPYLFHQLMMQKGYTIALYDITAEHVLAVLKAMGCNKEVMSKAESNIKAARHQFDPATFANDARSVVSAPARTYHQSYRVPTSLGPTDADDFDDQGDDAHSALSLEEDDAVDARLLEVMGGLKMIEKAINVFWRSCSTEPQLSPFFSSAAIPEVKASLLRFFGNALGVHHVSQERMFRIHSKMVAKGLDMNLFFQIMQCFLHSLRGAGASKEVMATAEVNFLATQVLFEDIIAKARAKAATAGKGTGTDLTSTAEPDDV